jgi:hypothetical protein
VDKAMSSNSLFHSKGDKVKEVQYYSANGYRLRGLTNGLCIVRTVYENGFVEVRKILVPNSILK